MKNERINELANFFYSSNEVLDVPMRISIETGEFSGFTLTKKSFVECMNILLDSQNLREDLENFREKYEQR